MAYRDMLVYNPTTERYTINTWTIEQSDVSPDDLKIDGEKWRVFKTPLELPEVPETRTEIDENGEEHVYLNPTPISWNLYYESDTINNASVGEFRSKIINPLILAILIGGGILFLIFMLMM